MISAFLKKNLERAQCVRRTRSRNVWPDA